MNIEDIFELLEGHSLESIDEQFIMDKDNYQKLTDYINNINKNTYPESVTKGNYLEEFLTFIIKHIGVFDFNINVRSSTNEIDLRAEAKGSYIPILSNYYKIYNSEVIYFECKNYSNKIDVSWIGKFFSLLNTSKRQLGIFISPNGITGTGWRDGLGLTKKIALKNDVYILSITLDDLLELNNKSLLMIIKEKLIALEEDIKIEFSKHDLEDDHEFII